MYVKEHKGKIIRAIWKLHYVELRHIVLLFFKQGALAHANKKLKEMTQEGLLYRYQETPNYPYSYIVGTQGAKYLRLVGEEVEKKYDPTDYLPRERFWLRHVFTINDVFIACTRAPELSLVDILHDLTIRQHMVLPVYPDLYAVFTREAVQGSVQGEVQVSYPLWAEIDRGTERSEEYVKRKINRMLDFYLSGEYTKAFVGDMDVPKSLTFAFITFAGAGRLQTLLNWTEDVLNKRYQREHASLFRFIALPQGEVDPQIFADSVWYIPDPQRHRRGKTFPLLSLAST